MSLPAGQPISLFAEVKLQAQALVPVLRALRTELGKDMAYALIIQPLHGWVRSVYHRIGEQKPGDARQKWEGVWDELRPRTGKRAGSR